MYTTALQLLQYSYLYEKWRVRNILHGQVHPLLDKGPSRRWRSERGSKRGQTAGPESAMGAGEPPQAVLHSAAHRSRQRPSHRTLRYGVGNVLFAGV